MWILTQQIPWRDKRWEWLARRLYGLIFPLLLSSLRQPDVILYESLTRYSTVARELFKRPLTIPQHGVTLHMKVFIRNSSTLFFLHRDAHRAVKLMTVSTSWACREQLPRFRCICIRHCTSDIIREMRNKGALRRWNKTSAVCHANQLGAGLCVNHFPVLSEQKETLWKEICQSYLF